MWSERVGSLGLLMLAAVAGCATLNEPLRPDAPRYEFAKQPVGRNTHSLFVCLTFSGGGTRAAALSYGVLEKLRDTEIEWKGQKKSLLDEVDCISSVSGGSFTAAYYGLFGDCVFKDFRSAFLEKNVERALFWRLLNPVNWFRLASPYFSRIDLAAEYYDKRIFDRRAFAAMRRPGGPFVILNATNLANGERFSFTQEQFDFLASDLGSYPVARAVAASSAFPFLLSPITLKNHPNVGEFTPPDGYDLEPTDYDDNRPRYYWAMRRLVYGTDKEALPWVHVMDGGLADNIGLRAVESAYEWGFIRQRMNDDGVERIVILVVNARTQGEDTISRRRKPPGILHVANATATIAMGNYSEESVAAMRELTDARVQVQDTMAACQQKLDACDGEQLPELASGDLEPSVIDVNFQALSDPERRKYFLELPTSFKLSEEQVAKLIAVGPELLAASPDFQDLLEELGAP